MKCNKCDCGSNSLSNLLTHPYNKTLDFFTVYTILTCVNPEKLFLLQASEIVYKQISSWYENYFCESNMDLFCLSLNVKRKTNRNLPDTKKAEVSSKQTEDNLKEITSLIYQSSPENRVMKCWYVPIVHWNEQLVKDNSLNHK